MLKKGKQKVPVYGLPCLPVDCNGLDCTRVALFVLLYTSCVNKAVINHGEGPLLHIGSARKAGKAIVRRRRSTFRSRLLGFRLAGCFRPCLAPRRAARQWSQWASRGHTCSRLGFPCTASCSCAAACEVRAIPFQFSFTSYPCGDC